MMETPEYVVMKNWFRITSAASVADELLLVRSRAGDQSPDRFLGGHDELASRLGRSVPDPGRYGNGALFLPSQTAVVGAMNLPACPLPRYDETIC